MPVHGRVLRPGRREFFVHRLRVGCRKPIEPSRFDIRLLARKSNNYHDDSSALHLILWQTGQTLFCWAWVGYIYGLGLLSWRTLYSVSLTSKKGVLINFEPHKPKICIIQGGPERMQQLWLLISRTSSMKRNCFLFYVVEHSFSNKMTPWSLLFG